VTLLVIEKLGEVTGCGFGYALTDGVIAVVDGLSCGGGGGTPTGGVVAIAEGTVACEVARRVVAVTNGFSAALALQPVAVRVGVVAL
jgi:hypothetical protein